MYKSKAIIGCIILVYILSVFFQFTGNDNLSTIFRALILPIIAIAYFIFVKRKSLFFILFLLCFSVSDLMLLIQGKIPYLLDYYLGNVLYLFAYLFLLLEISKSVSVSYVLRNFKLHILVLTALNIYIVYVLQVIVNPYVGMTNVYYMELVYNIVMLSVLSVALINYFYRDNKKALYLFIGSLAIVFSEVIDVAYMYISNKAFLNFLATTLAVIAFYFFLKQANLKNNSVKEYVFEE
jgi:hypothetical protein